MTAIEQIHNWSNFRGGEGDGFYLGPSGSYRAGRNIDTRILENGVKVCTKFEDTEITYNGDILEINPFNNLSFSTEDGNNGRIYEGGTSKLVLSSGTTAHNKIIGFGRLTVSEITYIYGFTQTSFGVGKIFRIAADYSSATDISQDFTLALGKEDNSNYMPVLSLPGRIVFGYGNTIYELSNTEILTELISFPKEAEIVSISYYLNKYKIYYNLPKYSNGPNDGYVNYWDGNSGAVDYFVKYENSGIKNVINDGAYDYVVFGGENTSDLYLMSGLNRQEIRVNTEGSTNNNTRLLGREGTIREGILYMMGENKLGEDCLYSYGSYYPGTSRSLVPENSSMSVNKLYADIEYLYAYVDDAVSSGTGAIYQKSFFYTGDKEVSGTIYSYPITGNYGGYTLKSINEIDVFYYLSSSSETIKIYTKKSGGPNSNNTTGRTLMKTINDADNRGIKIYSSELTSIGFGTFYQLEYKIELTSGALLYQVRTVYNDNIK